MTKNEFKQGDKVYMAYDPTISAVITDVCCGGKYDFYVREDGAEFMQGCYECELLDAKTAFLTRLQSLLREYDARICDGEGYMVVIDIDSESDKSERLFFELIYQDYITADNIMDFDKE